MNTATLGAMFKSTMEAFTRDLSANLETRFKGIGERMDKQDARIQKVAAEKKPRA